MSGCWFVGAPGLAPGLQNYNFKIFDRLLTGNKSFGYIFIKRRLCFSANLCFSLEKVNPEQLQSGVI